MKKKGLPYSLITGISNYIYILIIITLRISYTFISINLDIFFSNHSNRWCSCKMRRTNLLVQMDMGT